jgi:hypothetical protein|tara:strand:+ start:446 stop:922 length:477 start_codon:yes stop_codon:yes gene_type:complete
MDAFFKLVQKFLSRLDIIIVIFMYALWGNQLVILGNFIAIISWIRIEDGVIFYNLRPQLIIVIIVSSWVIMRFFNWYMRRYYPDVKYGLDRLAAKLPDQELEKEKYWQMIYRARALTLISVVTVPLAVLFYLNGKLIVGTGILALTVIYIRDVVNKYK